MNPYQACPCGSGKQLKWCCQPYYPLIEQARKQYQQGQGEASLQTAALLVEKHPKQPQAWGYQAELLYANGHSDRADAALQKAFDLEPNFAFGFWLRGNIRMDEGEEIGALLLFRKAAELFDPNSGMVLAVVHARIAEVELRYNRPVAARASIVKAIKLTPNSQEFRETFVTEFGNESPFPDCARRAYSFRPAPPERAEAWKSAMEGADSGRLTDALKAFDSMTAAEPADAAAWFNLGLVRAWLGDNRKAIDAFLRSIELDSEDRVEAAGALVEVLRCGRGLEEETDYLTYRAELPIRNVKPIEAILQDWSSSGRLRVVDNGKESGIFRAVLVEAQPNLTGKGVVPVGRLGAFVQLTQNSMQIWTAVQSKFNDVLAEARTKLGAAVGEPQLDRTHVRFSHLLAELMIYPMADNIDPTAIVNKQIETAQAFFEDTWLQRPLKSLAGLTPIDAAAHPQLKKRLPGLILIMSDCLRIISPRIDENRTIELYDFDRLRRKLGLVIGPVAIDDLTDFQTLSVADLAGLNRTELSDKQLLGAFKGALMRDAGDLAEAFARTAVARRTIADRYPFFNHLIQAAREAGKADEVLHLLAEGEQADAESNGGGRSGEYATSRGRAMARAGDADGAYAVFHAAVGRSSTDFNLVAAAAEAMLGHKQSARALEFAEHGLASARAQNQRDAEQQFLELAAAANKQIG